VRRRSLCARLVFLFLLGVLALPVSLGTLAGGGKGLFLLLGGFIILPSFRDGGCPATPLIKRGRLITPAAAFAQEDALHEH
jgi:hypothetical protein